MKIEPIKNGFQITPATTDFTILQVTDMHFHGYFPWGYERKDVKELTETCKKLKNDLLINTGDIFGKMPFPFIKQILNAFDDMIGNVCPWTFAWGNHDNENYPKKEVKQASGQKIMQSLDKIEATLENLPNCLYKQSREFIENYTPKNLSDLDGNPQLLIENEKIACRRGITDRTIKKKWEGFYGGNFVIEVCNPDTNLPEWDLFIMNSRRDYSIPPPALMWMRDHIESHKNRLPALVFFHVPNIEYHTLWEQEKTTGIHRERVCFEKETGWIHKIFSKFGVVKGCFVGHDHVNDYYGVKDGIYYVYGRKTGSGGGYGSYKDPSTALKLKRKAIKVGTKKISIHLGKGTWEFVSVLHDGEETLPSGLLNN